MWGFLPRLEGTIHNDTLGTFKDGAMVYTATVLAVTHYGTIAHTRKHKFKLDPPMRFPVKTDAKQQQVQDH